jgi:hypothetical protein
MAFPLASARKLCNDSEYALVAASFGSKEIAWTPAMLRSKIERSRKLRDKNRDKHRQIRRANRATSGAKTGKQVTAMAVAEKRAKLFDETLARYVAKLDKLNAAKHMKALKAAVADALVRKRAAQAAASGRGAAPQGPAGTATRRTQRPPAAVKGKGVREMARVRARNARNQAKRDARGD